MTNRAGWVNEVCFSSSAAAARSAGHGINYFPEISTKDRQQQLGSFIDFPSEERLIVEEGPTHADLLRSLAGKHKGYTFECGRGEWRRRLCRIEL